MDTSLEIVSEIVRLEKSGLTQREIGEAVGRGSTTVWKVLKKIKSGVPIEEVRLATPRKEEIRVIYPETIPLVNRNGRVYWRKKRVKVRWGGCNACDPTIREMCEAMTWDGNAIGCELPVEKEFF